MSGTMNQMNDLADVRKQLGEAVAKEMKNIDKKRFEKVTRQMQMNSDPHVGFVMDNLSRFLAEDEKSSYNATSDKYWSSHESFVEHMRKVDHTKMTKEWCEQLMKDITGGNSEGGAVAKAFVQAENVSRYMDFYPFFKTLSKMVYLAVTMRKENNFKRKIATGQKLVDQLDSKAANMKEMLDALNVHHEIRAEADRMYRDEETFIKNKLDKTTAQLQNYHSKLENFTADFFAGLPQAE